VVGLTPDEGNLLASALSQWGGPASPTDELAVALGFADAEDLVAEAARLADAFRDGASLAPGDIERALVAAEVVFISDTFGAGVEWETVTGADRRRNAAAVARDPAENPGRTRQPVNLVLQHSIRSSFGRFRHPWVRDA
jgi:hypothetical protein